jgi:hypothetical protein
MVTPFLPFYIRTTISLAAIADADSSGNNHAHRERKKRLTPSCCLDVEFIKDQHAILYPTVEDLTTGKMRTLMKSSVFRSCSA